MSKHSFMMKRPVTIELHVVLPPSALVGSGGRVATAHGGRPLPSPPAPVVPPPAPGGGVPAASRVGARAASAAPGQHVKQRPDAGDAPPCERRHVIRIAPRPPAVQQRSTRPRTDPGAVPPRASSESRRPQRKK